MLKSIASIGLLLCVTVVVTGCRDSLESVTEDNLECMEKMIEVLGTITDEATAQAALDDIRDLAEDIEEIRQRTRELADDVKAMPADEKMAVTEKFQERMGKAMEGFAREMMRLSEMPEAKEAHQAAEQAVRGTRR